MLDSACATVLDCGDGLPNHDRVKIQAVWHLLEMAKTMVGRSIECMNLNTQ